MSLSLRWPPPAYSRPNLRSPVKKPEASDWLEQYLITARTMTEAAEFTAFPQGENLAQTVVILLELVKNVKTRRMIRLCEHVMDIMDIIQRYLVSYTKMDIPKFKILCTELKTELQQVAKMVQEASTNYGALDIGKIWSHQGNVQTLRQKFMSVAWPGHINNCPPASEIFHGRQDTLDKMQQYFSEDSGKQHIYILYGLRGAGKTQIALKFVESSLSHFSDIFFIDTSTIQTVDAGFKNIAVAKNLGKTVDEIKQWLASSKEEWLLLFDGADDPNIDLSNVLPQCDYGNIVITSRNTGLRVYAGENSNISDMQEDEACQLLLKTASRKSTSENRAAALAIVKEWSCLPLAIIQAGAFIKKSGNLDSYLGLHAANKTRMLSTEQSQPHDSYVWPVYSTWQSSFDQLSPLAASFLQHCSFLHYEGISEEIFSIASGYNLKSLRISHKDLQASLIFLSEFLGPLNSWDSFKFQDVTAEIMAHSLMNLSPETNMFSMHPLVKEWCQDTAKEQEPYRSSMIGILGMYIAGVPQQDIQLVSIGLLSHIETLVAGESQIIPDVMEEYAKVYHYTGKYSRAMSLQFLVLQKYRDLLGDDHPDTLKAMANLASTYGALGHLEDAKLLDVVVLEKHKKLLGDDHPDTLQAMANLASTYRALGKLEDAKLLEVEVLKKHQKLLGDYHPHTLQAMANLASTFWALGQLGDAKLLEVGVLEKRKKLLGDDHPDTLQAMADLASTFWALGQLKDAKLLDMVVLEKRKKLLGDDHPDTLRAMANVASTHRALGQLKDAKLLGIEVPEKYKKLLGDDHPDTLPAMANLASTRKALGQLEDAKLLEVKVLGKHKKLLGDNHPDTLQAMANLASTFRALSKLEDAKLLEVEVLEKRKKLLGDNHPDTMQVMAGLASTCRALGEFEKARMLEVEVLEKYRKFLGEDHPHTLQAMASLASIYQVLGEFEVARMLKVEVLEKRKKLQGDDHPDTLQAMANLASTYRPLGQLEDAKLLEVEVLEKRKTHLGDDHADTLRAMANLASTNRALGQLEDAKLLEVEVLEKRKKLLGDGHPDTLQAMASLASTYTYLGQLEDAMLLEVEVLEKREKLLGDDHPDTLQTLAILASTCRQLEDKKLLVVEVLEKRKQLPVGNYVLEKLRQHERNNHPDTMGNLVDGDLNNATTSLSSTSNTLPNHNLALSSHLIDSTMSSLKPPVEVAQVSSNISTFMIHSPKSHKTSHAQNSAALCEEDIQTLNEYPAGGAITSVHSPDAAVFWLEANFEHSLLKSIQTHGLGGPIAAMLSPEEPTLVIFGSILDDEVLKIAEQLSEISKISVMVRPLKDNPITRWKSQRNEERGPDGHEGNFEDQSWTDDHDEDFNDEDSQPDSTDFEEDDLCPESEDLTMDDQDSDAIIASVSEHGQSPQRKGEVSFGKAWRLRGGALDSLWQSEWHALDVRLKISRPSLEVQVQILTQIQFTVQWVNKAQPQFVCHIKFKVDPKNTRSIESDRSYSNIGFLVKGMLIYNIEKRPFAEFEPPQQTQKAVHIDQRTFSGGFASPHSGGVGISYTRGGTEAKEQQNDKPTPKCSVYYHSGEPFEIPGCSCDSINVACVAEDALTNEEEQKVKHSMDVEYSAGIYVVNEEDPNKWDSEETETSFLIRNQTNLWIPSSSLKAGGQGIVVLTSAYIPDVENTDRMYVRDTPEVKLVNNTQIPPVNTAPDLHNSSIKRAVFISAAPMSKPQPLGRFKEAAKKIPKFLGIGTQNPRIIPQLYLHEYVARGWDVQWNEWRMPVYPNLTRQLQAVSKTDIAYELKVEDLSRGKGKQGPNPAPQLAANPNFVHGETTKRGPAASNPTINSDSDASGTKSDSLNTPNIGTVGTSFTSLTASTKSGNANENAVAGPSKTRI